MVWLQVPYFLLQQRYTRGQNQNSQTDRQQDFPSYLHELVKAISRERATIPDIHVHEPGNFGGEPENILHAKTDCGNKKNEANQSENGTEACKPDGLNAKERMLR